MQNRFRLRDSFNLLLGLLAISCGSSIELATDESGQAPAKFRASADPMVLVETDEHAAGLWVDDQRLYWVGLAGAGVTRLHSCKKQDCLHSVVTYGALFATAVFNVHRGRIYWLAYGDYPHDSVVRSCAVDGCEGAARDEVYLDAHPEMAALTGDATYSCAEHELFKTPLSGEPRVDLASVEYCIAIAVGGSFVYWLEQSGPSSTLFALRRVAIDGSGTPQLLVDNVRVPTTSNIIPKTLVVSSDFVYWSQGSLYGSVARCPLTGCAAPEVIAEPVRSPSGLLIDETGLYFEHGTSAGELAVSRLTLPHGAPSEPLLSGLVAESALATDATYLYASTSEAPASDSSAPVPWVSIRRIQKPTGAQP